MQMHQQPPFDLAISGVAQACAVRQCYSLHFGQLFTAHTGWLGLIYKAENAAQPMGYELQCTTQASTVRPAGKPSNSLESLLRTTGMQHRQWCGQHQDSQATHSGSTPHCKKG
jgi:hypothetical protein